MKPGRSRLAGALLAAVPLLALAAVCFARLLAEPSGLIVDPRRSSVDYANRGDPRPIGNDLVFLFLPHHQAIADRIERFGHWPLWDVRGFGGRPYPGNPQAGMAYPPAWIAWRWRAPAVLGWLTVAHLVWGGIGTYILLRSVGAGWWASTVAAGVYEASPYLLAHTFEGHYPHVWAACWYPWAFWAYGRLRGGRIAGLWLAPIPALCYLTGHPQEWLMLVLALSGWAIADGVRAWRSDGASRASSRFAGWLAILTLSVGLAGVDAVPQLLARPWLRRNHVPGFDGIPRRYHLGALNAFQLLDPMALGGPSDYIGDDNYWESVCAIGLVPLSLAVVGAMRHPDRRRVRGWLALTALAVVFACGWPLGLYPLCYKLLPGVGLIRVPARSLFLGNLAGAVLAGLGMEVMLGRMARASAWRRLARRLGMLGVVVVVGLLALGRGGSTHPVRAPARSASGVSRPPASGRTVRAAARVLDDPRFWSALVATSILVAAGCRPIGARRRRRIIAAIGVVAMAELAWYGYALLRVAPASRFVGPDPIGEALRSEAPRQRDEPTPPPRIKARDSFYGDLPASRAGFEKTNIGDAFQIDHASILYETLYPVASHVRPMAERRMTPAQKALARRIRQAVLDRTGVEYLVSDRVELDPDWPIAAEGMREDGSRYVIQRNPTAMPRAYVVPRAVVLPDHPEVMLRALASLDPRESIAMTVDPLAGLAPGPRQPFAAAAWISIDPDRPALSVSTGAPGLLVIADTWMPGWTASVDGRPVPVFRGNHAQRVIPLPEPGQHVVSLEYRPPGLASGCALTISSALAWAAWLGARLAGSRWRHPICDPVPSG